MSTHDRRLDALCWLLESHNVPPCVLARTLTQNLFGSECAFYHVEFALDLPEFAVRVSLALFITSSSLSISPNLRSV